jgi:hypothetical protein
MMEEILGGRSREEFIDFMSDMLIMDNALANYILSQHFNLYTKECYNLRCPILLKI